MPHNKQDHCMDGWLAGLPFSMKVGFYIFKKGKNKINTRDAKKFQITGEILRKKINKKEKKEEKELSFIMLQCIIFCNTR